MTDTQKIALKMIADPELASRTWKEACVDFRLKRNEDVDGNRYVCVMYSCWVYAHLADLIAADDDEILAGFIESVDRQRLVRDDKD